MGEGKSLPLLSVVVALVAVLVLWPGAAARAATKTWDGSSSGNWNNSQNWTPSGVPAAGDNLVFPTGVAQLVTTNGIPSLPAFNSITLLGANYVIRGAALKLTNGLFCGNASAANAIETDIEVRGPQAFVVTNQNASLLLRGAILSLGPHGLTLSGFGRMDISSAISGASGILKNGANTVLFHGANANTYVGITYVTQGTLKLSKTNATAIPGELVIGDGSGGANADLVQVLRGEQIADASAVTVNASGWLDCSVIPGGPGGNEYISSLTLNNGAHVTVPSSGSLAVTGPVACTGNNLSVIDGGGYLGLTAATPTIHVTGGGTSPNLDLQTHTAATSLTKTGPGRLRISTSSSVANDFYVNEGVLEVAHAKALDYAGQDTIVASGATLFLNGVSVSGESLILNGAGVGGTEGALKASVSGGGSLFWSGTVTLDSVSTIYVPGSLFGGYTHLSISNKIMGTGGLTKDGAGYLHLAGGSANTYSGTTTIRDGYLDLVKPSGVVAVPRKVQVGSGVAGASPSLHLSAAHQIADGFDVMITDGQFDLAGFAETIGTLNGSGNVNVAPGSSLTINPSAATCTYAGNIFGSGSLTKAGAGKLILAGANSHTGATYVSAGTLQVDGSLAAGIVLMDGAGRLTGTGTVGRIETKYGTLAPGSSPGLLTCSNYTCIYSQTVTNEFELDGPAPGAGYDQLNVRGTVSLNNSFLKASLGFTSALSNQFVIIANDGADAVTGTFHGLPQNATLTIGAEQFRISYTGGTGNDVALTQISGVFRPVLTIERIGPATVRLLWPTNNAAGFSLMSHTSLLANPWALLVPGPVILGTNFVLTNGLDAVRRFYRLETPSNPKP